MAMRHALCEEEDADPGAVDGIWLARRACAVCCIWLTSEGYDDSVGPDMHASARATVDIICAVAELHV